MELGEGLSAIASLEKKGLAFRHRRELLAEPARFASKYQRWRRSKLILDSDDGLEVRLVGLLLDWLRAPAIGCPRHMDSISPQVCMRGMLTLRHVPSTIQRFVR